MADLWNLAPAAHPLRMSPLPPAGRDPRTSAMLDPLTELAGRELNIFATLARHPTLFRRWIAFAQKLLAGGTLPPRDRELVILRTAQQCQAAYEWDHHIALALECGVTEAEIEQLGRGDDGAWGSVDAALLAATDQLHRDAVVDDATWSVLRSAYDDEQLIELLLLVGQYHLVAFATNSLGVQNEEPRRLGP